MNLEQKIRKSCGDSSEVEVVNVSLSEMHAEIHVPYEIGTLLIDLEGSTDDEIIESFIQGVNIQLNRMIDHLNDCKL